MISMSSSGRESCCCMVLVLAQEGAFGIGILEVENEVEAREFGENDPSVLAGLNRFEIAPMKVTNARSRV